MQNSHSLSNARTAWVVLAFTMLARCIIYIPYIGYSTDSVQIMEKFSLSHTDVGVLASYPAFVYGVLSLFTGILIDKFGGKKVIQSGLLVYIVSELIWAIAPSFGMLMFARIIGGVGQAFIFIATSFVAMDWFEDSPKLPVSMGIVQASEGAGTLIGLYAFAIILSTLGHRNGSLIGTTILFASFIICQKYIQDRRRGVDQKEAPVQLSGRELMSQYVRSIKNHNVLMVSLIACGLYAMFSISVYWVPTILVEDAGYGTSSSGIIGALYPFAGSAGALVVSAIATRIRKRKLLLSLTGLLTTLACIGMIVGIKTEHWFLLSVSFMMAGALAYAESTIAFVVITETVDYELLGNANGLIYGIAALVGGTVFPYALGVIKDTTSSYLMGFLALVISVFVMMFLSALWIKEKQTTDR